MLGSSLACQGVTCHQVVVEAWLVVLLVVGSCMIMLLLRGSHFTTHNSHVTSRFIKWLLWQMCANLCISSSCAANMKQAGQLQATTTQLITYICGLSLI
jgi:hypothetical protein